MASALVAACIAWIPLTGASSGSASRPSAADAPLERAKASLDAAREKIEAKDPAAARRLLDETLDALAAAPGSSEDPDVAEIRIAIARAARWLGHVQASLRAWQAVHEYARRAFPEDHPHNQKARANLGDALNELGEFRTARGHLEKAVESLARTAPDGPELRKARLDLGNALTGLGEFQAAKDLSEEFIETYAGSLPPDHPDLQRARLSLASALSGLGELGAARILEERAVGVLSRTLPDDDVELQCARHNLAVTLSALGDLDEARRLQEKALAVLSQRFPDDHPYILRGRLHLATICRKQGRPADARPLDESVFEARSRMLPDDHADLQRARTNLAATLYALGHLKEARVLLAKVLDVYSKGLPPGHPELETARLNLAATMFDLGDLTGARALEEEVLAIRSRTLPDDHPDLQRARQNLAVTLNALGDLEGARALDQKVLDVRERTLPDDHLYLLLARQNLAVASMEVGDVQEARKLQEKVLDVLSRRLPDDHQELQVARGNLAVMLALTGELAGARKLQEKVLDVFSRTLADDQEALQWAREALLSTVIRLRDRDAARQLASEMASGARKGLEGLGVTLSPRELESFAMLCQKQVGAVLSVAAGAGAFAPDPALDREAFAAIESLRAAGGRLQRDLRRRAARSDDPEIARLVEAIETRARDIAAAAIRPPGTEGETAPLAKLVRERDMLLSSLRARIQETAGGAPEAVTGERVAGALGKGKAAVTFHVYRRSVVDPPVCTRDERVPRRVGGFRDEEEIAAFVVRPPHTLLRVDLGRYRPIEEAVTKWRDLFPSGGRGIGRLMPTREAKEQAIREAGLRIRELVFDPLRAALGDASEIEGVLDGALHLVPLDALPDGDGVVGDRFAIRVRRTLAEILDPTPRPASPPSLLVLGGVDYGRGSAPGAFGPLPETDAEAREVAETFRSSFDVEPVSLAGPLASRERFLLIAPRVRFLHVASHGYFAPESIRSIADPRPLDRLTGIGHRMTSGETVFGLAPSVLCGLVFAGANGEPDVLGRSPGILTAEELAALDLSRCELAILSACETNVGVRRAGQGIASLQQALFSAGVRTAVTSLWMVPDEPTRILMAEFYRRIWREKEPKARALWEAKLALRNRRDESGRPRHGIRDWAGWVLTGDPD